MKNVFYFGGSKHTKHVTLSGITMKTCNDDHISSFQNVFLMDKFFISDHFSLLRGHLFYVVLTVKIMNFKF